MMELRAGSVQTIDEFVGILYELRKTDKNVYGTFNHIHIYVEDKDTPKTLVEKYFKGLESKRIQ